MSGSLRGRCEPGFDLVAEVTEEVLAEDGTAGLGVAVYWHGELVVDLSGGDARPGVPWSSSTVVPLTSISKVVLALLVLHELEAQSLGVDTLVRSIWPGFAAGGKGGVTLAQLMSHEAGVACFEPTVLEEEVAEWTPVVERLERAVPEWVPGSAHGYHAVTLGFALTEILRRLTGSDLSDLLESRLATPSGLELWNRPDGSLSSRLVHLHKSDDAVPDPVPPSSSKYVAAFQDPGSLLNRATFGSIVHMTDLESGARTRRPHVYGTVAAVAGVLDLWGRPGSRGGWLSDTLWLRAVTPGPRRQDRTFQVPTRYGLGLMMPTGPLWRPHTSSSFGHIGSAGSLAYFDRAADLAFAFVTNSPKSIYQIPDLRGERLSTAVYRACAGSRHHASDQHGSRIT